MVGVFLCFCNAAAQASPAQITYVFGVAPPQPMSDSARLWNPLVTYLEQQSGYRLEFRTGRDVTVYGQRLDKGELDISYKNPYHYTLVPKTIGYEVFTQRRYWALSQ